MSSQYMEDKSPLKGAWSRSHDWHTCSYSIWQDFNWHRTSRGLSAIAEPPRHRYFQHRWLKFLYIYRVKWRHSNLWSRYTISMLWRMIDVVLSLWWAQNRQKLGLEGFLRRSTRSDFVSNTHSTLAKSVWADQNLFCEILHNPEHALHLTSPPAPSFCLYTRWCTLLSR